MAKGKPMAISWDQGRKGTSGRPVPTGPKGSGNSLLNRIAAAPLVDRLAKPRPASDSGDKPSQSRARTARGNKTGPGGKGASGKPARMAKAPKTAEDLDRELEAYLGDENGTSATPASDSEAIPTTVTLTAEDIEMA